MDFVLNTAANGPFLLMALPLFGVLLTLATRRFGAEAAYRTALTNVALCCLTSAAMFVALPHVPMAATSASPSDPRIDDLRLVTAIPWFVVSAADTPATLSGRLSVGVTSATALPVLLVPWITLAAIVALRPNTERQSDSNLIAVLLCESFLVSGLAALDLLFWSVALAMAPLPLWWLVARHGQDDHRTAARRFLLPVLAGALFLFLALNAIGLTLPMMLRLTPEFSGPPPLTLDLPTLVRALRSLLRSSSDARISWALDGPWCFAGLALAIGLLSPMPPFRKCWLGLAQSAPPEARILVAAWAFVSVAAAGRTFAPLLIETPDPPTNLALLVLAALAALAALRAEDAVDFSIARLSAAVALALLASVAPNTLAHSGAVWCLSATVLTTVLHCLSLNDTPGSQPKRVMPPRPAIVWLVGQWAMLPGFVAVLQGVLRGTVETQGSLGSAVSILAVWTVVEAKGLRLAREAGRFNAPAASDEDSVGRNLTPSLATGNASPSRRSSRTAVAWSLLLFLATAAALPALIFRRIAPLE